MCTFKRAAPTARLELTTLKKAPLTASNATVATIIPVQAAIPKTTAVRATSDNIRAQRVPVLVMNAQLGSTVRKSKPTTSQHAKIVSLELSRPSLERIL